MANRRYVFKHHIQFTPRSQNDLLIDDPTASKNVIIPLETDNWKDGVYYDDGYDYKQHLVTLEDFNDESKELPKIDYNKTVTMAPCIPTKSAHVISEFEVNESHLVTEDIRFVNNIESIKEIEKQHDLIALEKLRDNAKNEIDEDILFALQNAKDTDELSEDDILDDNFIELADMVPNKHKGANTLMERMFFGDDLNVEKMDEEEEEENDINFNFMDAIKGSINEISRMQYDYGDVKKLKLSDGNTTSLSTVSKSFINRLERHNERQNDKKEFIHPIDEEGRKFIINEETEYNDDDVDKAVKKWAQRSTEISKNALDVHGKVSKIKPKEIRVEKINKKDNGPEEMDGFSTNSQCSETFIDVSQFNVPRPPNETSIERTNRKRKIKDAKRLRQVQKKELKYSFATS